MRTRELGATGLRVSEIAFGAWGIGGKQWIGAQDTESMRVLRRAAGLGVNCIDTAWAYGDGHSEEIIGRFLRTIPRHRRPLIATKIPPKNFVWPASPATRARDIFPPRWIAECTETSLRRLGIDRIDLQQLHVFAAPWSAEDAWVGALDRLRRQGKIRCTGVSLTEHDPDSGLALVRDRLVDAVQVIYNLFDQAPARRLFPLALEKGVGILVRVPLDEGGLSGTLTPGTVFPPGDFRRGYFHGNRLAATCRRVEALKPVLLREGVTSVAEGALRFCLGHPAVSTVIVGMRTMRHLEANCRVSDGSRLPPAQLRALAGHAWRRNYYTDWDKAGV